MLKAQNIDRIDAITTVAGLHGAVNTVDDLIVLLSRIGGSKGMRSPITRAKVWRFSRAGSGKDERYKEFTIAKKNGGERYIHSPIDPLKHIQECINIYLRNIFTPSMSAYGFLKGRSIIDNANVHIGKNYVYNIDLKDFFHSFDRNRVKMGFYRKPIGLSGTREPIAYLLACLSTHKISVDGMEKHVLPQGSPCSPIITNLLCLDLDRRLKGLANRFGANYTRYADDITFSSMHNIYTNKEFLDELHRIIEVDQKLKINTTKVRLQKRGYRQMVTGLVVNEKLNVTRKYVKDVRKWLYLWERYGEDKALRIYQRNSEVNDHVSLGEVLKGKVDFVKQVKGWRDGTYRKLNERLRHLLLVSKALNMPGIDPDRLQLLNEPNIPFDVLDALAEKHMEKEFPPLPQHILDEIDKQIEEKEFPPLPQHILDEIDKQIEENPPPLPQKILDEIANADMPSVDLFDLERPKISKDDLQESENRVIEGDDSGAFVIDKRKYVHSPGYVVSYLRKFRFDKDFKYITHEWDTRDNQEFDMYIKFINEFEDDWKILRSYNAELFDRLIYPFVFQSTFYNKHTKSKKFGWGKYNLKFGWQYPKKTLSEWCRNNSGTPFEMEVPAKYLPKEPIHGVYLKYFEDFINVFKNSIEFRGNSFNRMIKRLVNEHMQECEVEIDLLDKTEFYTDTGQVEYAIKLMLKSMSKYSELKNIRITSKESETLDYLVVEIEQIGSYCDRFIKHEKIFPQHGSMVEGGDFGAIMESLKSLCHWSVESRFRNENNELGYYKINYLNKNRKVYYESIKSASGFKHELHFLLRI